MTKDIKDFYLQTSMYTHPGPFFDYFQSLSSNVNELRRLVSEQHIHKFRLARTHSKEEISKNFQWLNCINDALNTSTAMTSEIFRLNSKGFILNKPENEKIVVTCRYMSILFASILKAKGIPTRCRSGFASYIYEDYNVDHWINEYWSEERSSWIAIDAQIQDSLLIYNKSVNLCDIKDGDFEYPAKLWLKARRGELNLDRYTKYSYQEGLQVIAHALFLDFHALNNYEVGYRHTPIFIYEKNFKNIKEVDLLEIDKLAKLILDPDKNFQEIRKVWETNSKFRTLRTPYINPFTDWNK